MSGLPEKIWAGFWKFDGILEIPMPSPNIPCQYLGGSNKDFRAWPLLIDDPLCIRRETGPGLPA